MKKMIIFLGLLLIAVVIQAQSTSGTTYLVPVNGAQVVAFNKVHTTYWTSVQLADSIGGTASKNWVFLVNKPQLYYYQFLVTYDSVLYHPSTRTTHRTAWNHVEVDLFGSMDGVYYTFMDSVVFHPTGGWMPAGQAANATRAAEGVQNLKDLSTGCLYKYLKLVATGKDAGKASIINSISLKIGLRY
jgi:hypothetical protein